VQAYEKVCYPKLPLV